MNILLSAYACDPYRGSEPGYAWNLAYHLTLRGHEVHVLTRASNRPNVEQELAKMQLPNLHFYFLPVSTENTFFHKYIPYQFIYYLWQKEIVRYARTLNTRFDVMHHVTWGSLKVGSFLWKLNLPFLFGPVGGGQMADLRFVAFWGMYWWKEAVRSLQTYTLRFLPSTKKLIQNTDMFLSANLETSTLISLAHHTKPGQVQLFCDSALPDDFLPSQYTAHVSEPELKILWVGRIIPRKGLKFAFYALRKVKTPFHLTIVGDGYLRKYIPDWIDEYQLHGKVTCVGHVHWQELKQHYSNSNVFLFPSLQESFGGQLLEAMAYGLPIVTLNQFGARDFVPDSAGIKIKTDEPEQTANRMAQALEDLWHHPDLREQMGRSGYEYAKTQTWRQRVTVIEKKYEEMLSRFEK